MGTLPIPGDLREFLQLLGAHAVRYLLIGGYAVGYHGYVRATGDMDVWVSAEPANAAKLVDVVLEFGFDVPELTPELFTEPGVVVRLGEPPFRIELLNQISGVSFEECYAARVIGRVDGLEVPVIGLEHLRQNKAASGRHKDLDDLEHLRGRRPRC